jgi:hypothetical protein
VIAHPGPHAQHALLSPWFSQKSHYSSSASFSSENPEAGSGLSQPPYSSPSFCLRAQRFEGELELAPLLLEKVVEGRLFPDGLALGEPVAEGVLFAAAACAGDRADGQGALEPVAQGGDAGLVEVGRPFVEDVVAREFLSAAILRQLPGVVEVEVPVAPAIPTRRSAPGPTGSPQLGSPALGCAERVCRRNNGLRSSVLRVGRKEGGNPCHAESS